MKTSLLLATTLIALSTSNAEAVITRRCPEALTIQIHSTQMLSEEEIRELPRHRRYHEDRLMDAIESRDRLEALLETEFQTGYFSLVSRESGKCIYLADEKSVEMNRVVLFSKGGVDYLKQEIELYEKLRTEEFFSFQAELASYSTDGIELANDGETEVLTTVKQACYDRVCLADAQIGTAWFSAE